MTRRPPAPAASGGAPSPRPRGFTLIELMVVMSIMGVMLLWLPPRLDGFGDRSKLVSTASTIVSVITGARELAIIDGHEVRVQYDLPGTTRDREKTGRFRYVVGARHRKTPDLLAEPGATDQQAKEPEIEDEWITTEWRDLPKGVVMTGFSQEAGAWIRSNPGDAPIEVSFLPDGTVRPAHAIQLTSVDLPSDAARVMTVRVNALTSLAEVVEGEADLPKGRDPNEFR